MKLGEVLKLNKISKIDIEDLKKYKISGVQNYGQGIVIRREVFGSELNMKKYQVISKNQLMWCKVDTKNGAFGLTHKEHIGSLASTNMALADIDTNKIDPEFLEILFRQKPFADYITNLSSGTTNRKYLTPKQLFDVVKLPDLILQEQKRFVEKLKRIEALKIESEIQTQKQLLTNLKQAILQEAIQGKLTQDWRTRHPELVEGQHSAEHLLQRIKTEKAQLIKEGKIKKEKPLPKITKEEIPFEIPKGWVWCRLGEVTTYGSSEKIDSQKIKDNTWVLDLEDIEKESSKILQFKTFSERPSLSTKSVFKKGWVLYSKLRPYLDKVVVVPKDGVCTTEILPLPIYGNMNAYFLMYTLKGKHFLNYVNSKVGGMKMPRLGTDDGKMALIPLAPIEEQKEIVKKVESLKQKCTALEQEVTQSETNAQMLMQAVLKEAFEG